MNLAAVGGGLEIDDVAHASACRVETRSGPCLPAQQAFPPSTWGKQSCSQVGVLAGFLRLAAIWRWKPAEGRLASKMSISTTQGVQSLGVARTSTVLTGRAERLGK